MVRIRLSRGGAKKKPFYHIVVMDQRQRRDGRCLEKIGTYDPSLSTNERIKLNHERLDYWKSKGAQLSERVKLLREYSLDENSASNRLVKKEKDLDKLKQKGKQRKKQPHLKHQLKKLLHLKHQLKKPHPKHQLKKQLHLKHQLKLPHLKHQLKKPPHLKHC